MLKGFQDARLACGCRLRFEDGVEGSPVTVVIKKKSPSCRLSIHVEGMAVYDFREALRASTRISQIPEGDYEEEG